MALQTGKIKPGTVRGLGHFFFSLNRAPCKIPRKCCAYIKE